MTELPSVISTEREPVDGEDVSHSCTIFSLNFKAYFRYEILRNGRNIRCSMLEGKEQYDKFFGDPIYIVYTIKGKKFGVSF